MIRLDHQHLGEQFALRVVPIRRLETLVGTGIAGLVFSVVVVPRYVGTKIAPSMTAAALAARTGTGQRTTLVPIRRYSSPWAVPLGSMSPKRLPNVNRAGPSVSAAAMVNSMVMATAGPMVWK